MNVYVEYSSKVVDELEMKVYVEYSEYVKVFGSLDQVSLNVVHKLSLKK